MYFAITVGIGFYANRKISGDTDFINAGRNLHPALNAFALFALWFGSETLFGASAEFAEHGLLGVIEDPFGAILCLLLVGFFYSKKMYRLNVLTIGDLFRERFGNRVELIASALMVLCFIGYIAAQLLALGLIVSVLFGLSLHTSIIASALIVMTYTMAGGMLAVTLTDFIQSILIIVGLVAVAYFITDKAGGVSKVLASIPPSHWHVTPDHKPVAWINWVASLSALGLGSIVSQDIFQRVNSARSEKAAYYSSITGALIYSVFAFLPMFIIMATKIVYPHHLTNDLQLTLPRVVLEYLPMPIKILFFGSVLSAIMSTASGAILAPASLASENILKPLFFTKSSDYDLLKVTRWSIVSLTLLAVFLAMSSEKIYGLVGDASAFGLVSMFVPYTAALFFGYNNRVGAMVSMTVGPLVWIYCNYFIGTMIDPLVYGFLSSLIGIPFGYLFNKIVKN